MTSTALSLLLPPCFCTFLQSVDTGKDHYDLSHSLMRFGSSETNVWVVLFPHALELSNPRTVFSTLWLILTFLALFVTLILIFLATFVSLWALVALNASCGDSGIIQMIKAISSLLSNAFLALSKNKATSEILSVVVKLPLIEWSIINQYGCQFMTTMIWY